MKPIELKKIRARIGITQAELAFILGVSVRTVQKWEIGERRIPLIAEKFIALQWPEIAPKNRAKQTENPISKPETR